MHHGRRRKQHRPHGHTMATACENCYRDVIPGGTRCDIESAPGAPAAAYVGPICRGHIAELEAAGWVIIEELYGDPGALDAVCPCIGPPPPHAA